MATYYWVGGSGNWYDGAHWATTSGGTGNAIPAGQGPTYADDVIFNSSSSASSYQVTLMDGNDYTGGAYNWTVNAPASGTLTLVGSSTYAVYVYNSLTIAGSNVTQNMSKGWKITSTKSIFQPTKETSHEIYINTGNNPNFSTCPFEIDVLSTDLWLVFFSSALTCGALKFTTGSIYTQNYNINAASLTFGSNFANAGGGNIYWGTSTVTISGSCNLSNMSSVYNNIQYSETPSDVPFNVTSTWNVATISAGMGGGGPPSYTLYLRTNNQSTYQTLLNNINGWQGQDFAYGFQLTGTSISNGGIPAEYAYFFQGSNFVSLAWAGSTLTGDSNNVSVFSTIKAGDTFTINTGSTVYTVLSNTSDAGPGAGVVRLNCTFGGSESVSYISVTKNYGAYVNLLGGNVNIITDLGYSAPYYSVVIQMQFCSFSNGTAAQPTVVYAGGGSFNIVLTGSTSSYTGGSTGYPSYTPTYIPKLTLSSTAPNADPHFNYLTVTPDYKQISSLHAGKLDIQGPSSNGYTVVMAQNAQIIIRKSVTINSNANQLRRVFFRGSNFQGAGTSGQGYYDYFGTFAFEDGYTPTVSINDTDFSDIRFAGSNVVQTGVRVGNANGNSITNTNFAFSTPSTLYWSGAAGGTITANTTNWATTDGGTPVAGLLPMPQDTVKFTNNTLNTGATLTVGASELMLPTLDFTSRTNAVTLAMGASDCFIYGDIKLSSAVTMTASAGIAYLCGSNNITTNGVTITKTIGIWTTKTVTLKDNLTSVVSYASTTVPSITFLKGYFDIQDRTITSSDFSIGVYPAALVDVLKTLLSNSGTTINVNGTISGMSVWNNQNAYGFSNGGYSPKVVVSGNTTQTRYVNNLNNTQNEYCDPVDVYLAGGTGSVYLRGMFGTIDNTASPSKTNLLLNGTTFVKTSLKLLDGSSAGGGYTMYFIPPVGTTLEIIPNWVVGQGAVGTAGSTVSAIVIGYSSFPDLGTTRYPSKLYTGNLDVASGTLDMTNTVTTVTNLQTQYATYGNRVINLTGAVITTTGNFPGFFQGYNVSIIYNSATNIIITNSSSDCNIGYVSTTGLTSLPTFTINTTRQVICNGGTYENIVASSGQTLTLASSYTNIFKKLTLTGTAVNPVIVKSNVHPSTRATLQRNGGYQDFTGVTFQSINFTGSALARAWSSTNSNTVGITFKTGKKTPESSFLSLC